MYSPEDIIDLALTMGCGAGPGPATTSMAIVACPVPVRWTTPSKVKRQIPGSVTVNCPFHGSNVVRSTAGGLIQHSAVIKELANGTELVIGKAVL